MKDAKNQGSACMSQRQKDLEDYEKFKTEYEEVMAESRCMKGLIESKKNDLDVSILAEKDAEKTLSEAQKRLEIAKTAATDADRPKSDLRKHIGELVQKLKDYKPLI